MNRIKKVLLLPIVFVVSAVSGYASTIDFVALANGAGGYGESEYSNVSPLLTVVDPNFTLTVKAFNASGAIAGAYLDAGHGGLGVCSTGLVSGKSFGKQGSSTANVCGVGSDDNVTTGERLVLSFDKDVFISTILFNDNHDTPNTMVGGTVNINGVTTSPFTAAQNAGGGDSALNVNFALAANTNYTIAYSDREFYISSITVTTPEPAPFVYMGFGLLGIGLVKLRAKRAFRSNN